MLIRGWLELEFFFSAGMQDEKVCNFLARHLSFPPLDFYVNASDIFKTAPTSATFHNIWFLIIRSFIVQDVCSMLVQLHLPRPRIPLLSFV